MGTLKELAKAYTQPKTLNIADLPEVSIDFSVVPKVGKNENGEEFDYNVIELNGNEYRVPNSVLDQLKVFIEANPAMKKFKVVKTGQGMNTRYQVIPL